MWDAFERSMKTDGHVNLFINKSIKRRDFYACMFQLPPNGMAPGRKSHVFPTKIFIFSGKIIVTVGEVVWEGEQGRHYSLSKGIYSFHESRFSALHMYTILWALLMNLCAGTAFTVENPSNTESAGYCYVQGLRS